MAQTILLKRSATPGKVPLTTDLALGEIGINTYDGKMYFEKDNGTASIVQVGTVTSVGGTGTVSGLTLTGTVTGSGSLTLGGTLALVNADIPATLTGKTYNGLTLTSAAIGFTIAGGTTSKTLTVSNTLTLTGTDASSIAFGAGGTVAYTSNNLSAFAATTSAQLAGVISDETGSGALVFATSPTLVTPNIGVATGTSFNSITGLSSTSPVMSGTAAVGTGVTVARADHVHPSDTSKLSLTGGTLTGALTVSSAAPSIFFNETDAALDLKVWSVTADSSIFQVQTRTDANVYVASPMQLTRAGDATFAGTVAADSFNSITGLSSTSPVMNGTAAVGTGVTVARADHVHPSDTSKLSLAGGTMTGSIVIPTGQHITVTDAPVSGTDAVNKNYVDANLAGLSWKDSARIATTANITLSGLQTIDGLAVTAGMRVLVKDQTTASQNGIYVASATAWTRADDMDATTPINELNSAAVFVEGGSTQQDTGWTQINAVTTLGTDAIAFTQFNGAAGITAGVGLTKTGNQLDISLGAGIAQLPTDEVGIDVYATGGLMTTVDGTASSTLTNAQLSLTKVGTAGTYKSVTTDAYGRITAGTNPTTLAGYGITDASLNTHTHILDGLSDVTITTNSAGEILKWDGTAWINNTLAEAGIQAAGSFQPLDADLTSWAGVTRATGFDAFTATPTSANLATLVTDETGSGALVFATSPTLVTPVLGVATGTSFNSITGLSSTTPLINGTAAVGTGVTVARADHVHPTDTTRAADSSVVHLAGSETITGFKTFSTAPLISAADTSIKATIQNTSSTAARWPGLGIVNYSGAFPAGFPVIELQSARGTSAAPTAVQSGDILGGVNGWGWNGTGFDDVCRIQFAAASNFNGTTDDSAIEFWTQSGTTLAKRMHIYANGVTEFLPGSITSNFYIGSTGGGVNPIINFDSSDNLYYDRTANAFNFVIGSTNELSLSSTTATFGGNVSIADNNNLYIGTGNDLYAIHDGTNSSIVNQTGNLTVSNTNTAGSLVLGVTSGSNFELWSSGAYLDATTTYFRNQAGSSNYAVLDSSKLQSNVPILVNANATFGQLDTVAGSASTWHKSMFRNDGTNFYFLLSGLQTTQALAVAATWNATRPLTINMSTGAITLDSTGAAGTNIGGNLTVGGTATGTSFNSITGLSATTPLINGTAAIGTATTTARADHVHPTDTTRATDSLVVHLAGSETITGTKTFNAGLVIPTGTDITITDSPVNGTDGVNKNYVDSIAAGLTWKNSVKAATTANITLSAPQTVDGIALVAGDRVLVKNQTTTSQNGIYVVAAAAWTRSTDMDQATPLNEFNGAGTFVTGGTTQNDTAWTVSSTVTTVGTDAVTWAQFSGASVVAAGTGLTLTGNSLSVNASQTQITSVGTLGSLAVTGAITGTSFNSITGLSSTTPAALGTAAVGTGVTTARADHVHAMPNLDGLTDVTITTNSAGEILKWSGTEWINNTLAEAGIQAAGSYQPLDADLTSWAAITRATGIDTFITTPTSANLAAAVTDETGSGALVFATSPTLVTPVLGVATGTSFNSITGLSSTSPVMSGTAAVGTGTTVARADHVHPSDTSKLSLTGGTVSGSIIVSNATPSIYFYETDAAVDAKQWLVVADGANFQIQTRTDANAYVANALTLTRAGNATFAGAVTAPSHDTTYGRTTSGTLVTGAATTQVEVPMSLAAATYRTVEYTIQATVGATYHTSNVHVIHDGTNTWVDEYSIMFTGSSLYTVTADISGGNIRLLVTPASATATTFKVVATAIEV